MTRYLVINPFGIGDALFSLHVVDAIHQSDSLAEIHFLGNERTRELLELCPQIQKVYEFNRDRLRGLRHQNLFSYLWEYGRWIRNFRRASYDVLIDFSLGREFALLGAAAGIKKRVGLNYKNRGFFLSSKITLNAYDGKPVHQTQLETLRFLGIHKPSATKAHLHIPREATLEIHDWLSQNVGKGREMLLGLAPGGGKSWGENARYKQWPVERFADCANRFFESQSGTVLLFGDASEEPLLRQCATKLNGPHHVICGQPIRRVAPLLKECRALLCNDGGLMHLASNLGVPLTAVFGPVDETAYGPAGQAPSHVLTHPVSCRPCYRQFKFTGCAHQQQCLMEISSDEAWSSIKKWLSPA